MLPLLMLYRETMTAYFENHMEHVNTMFERTVEYLVLKKVVNILTIRH